MTELWMPVEGFCGYEVSDHGQVRSCKQRKEGDWRILKPTICTKGYRQVRLWKNGRRYQPMVHQLVMMEFNGPPPDDGQSYDCHHKNGRGDVPDNLEWQLHHEHWRAERRHRR